MNFIMSLQMLCENDLQTVNTGIREWYNNMVGLKTTPTTASSTTTDASFSEYTAYLKF